MRLTNEQAHDGRVAYGAWRADDTCEGYYSDGSEARSAVGFGEGCDVRPIVGALPVTHEEAREIEAQSARIAAGEATEDERVFWERFGARG